VPFFVRDSPHQKQITIIINRTVIAFIVIEMADGKMAMFA
jgi:hypothetical protein